jgi:NAD+ kinase
LKTIGLTAHSDRPLIKETTERILRWSEKNGLECRLCTELSVLVGRPDPGISCDDIWKSCEVIITLGGDGSMLASARAFGRFGVPILGINLGKLGFLTEVAQNQIEESLARLKDNKFKIEERMVLEATLPNHKESYVALNDVVVDHGEEIRLAKIDLFANDEFVCPYDSDGIVIATPTGSTAYSLSAGGPIINPLMESIAVSPISPHTLALRTIIFPSDSVLVVRAGSDEINLRVALDGQIVGHLNSGDEVVVKKADYKVRFIKFDTKSFYEILRTKLHWGARPLFST